MSRRKSEQDDYQAISFSRKGDLGLFTIRGTLSLEEVENLLATAQKVVADQKLSKVELHCEGLERLDLSNLQVLLALRKELGETGRSFAIADGTSEAVQKSFRMVGLQ